MSQQYFDLFLYIGADFSQNVSITDSFGQPYSLGNSIVTGYIATSSLAPDVSDLTCTIDNVNPGIVNISMTANNTLLLYTDTQYLYSIFALDVTSNLSTLILHGTLYVNGSAIA